MTKHLFLCWLGMLCTVITQAQNTTVTGRVTDGRGASVPFATISEIGTVNSVVSDSSGRFSIATRQGASLGVTAVGFTGQTLTVSGATLNFQLIAGQGNLQEVVVTALGIRRSRNQVPYAAQQITGDEVSRNRSNNFLQNISGRISGLEIRQGNTLGSSTNAVIRGFKSIGGTNQALFVVDGVPFDNSTTNSADQRTGRGGYDYGNAAADINPDDIESITVLKGAAATALYGSRAGNGVILITTKKGARSLGITINSGIGVGSIDKSTFVKYQKQYGGGYGAYYEDPTLRFLYRDINGDGVKDLVTPTSEDASYGGAFDPNLQVYQWDAFDPSSPYFGKSRPWTAAANDPSTFFQHSLSSNQSVFVNSGNDRGSFKLGFTRTDDKGIVANSTQTKNLFDFGATYNLTSALTAGATLNFSNVSAKGRYGTGYTGFGNVATNFRQWWQTNVDVKELKDAYFRNKNNVTWNWADPTDLTPIYWNNPYWDRYENYESDSRDRVFGNVNATYKVTNWLNILGRVSLDRWNQLTEERIAVGSVDVSNYNRSNQTFQELNFDLLANVERNLSTDLLFRGLVGTNIRRSHVESLFASTNGGLTTPRFYALSNSANPINIPTETSADLEVDGVFAGATLSWRNMVTLDGTIRRDQTTTLPAANNSYYYPSGSLGFVFSRLLANTPWLSYGKLRVNYAQVGNGAPANSLFDVYTSVPQFGSQAQYSVPGTKNNPNLKPELTKSSEAGIELQFLKNRIGLDFTYYNALSFNQILPVTVSTATGYSSLFVNAGNIRNKGIEVSLTGTPVQSKDFSWNMTLNWTRNRNKVEALYADPTTGNITDNLVLGSFQGGVTLNATLNQPYGTIRGSDFIYTNGQKTVGADGHYQITGTSNSVIGNPNPNWIAGLNNTVKYRDISLSWLLDMRQGGDLFSLDLYYGLATGLYPETAATNDLGNPSRNSIANGGGVVLNGVTADGKANTKRVGNSNFGLYGYQYNPAKAFVYDASYLKLREVVLSYAVPKTLVGKLNPFKGIDISVIGRNLWLIHKNLPYADPEEIISAGNLQGYQVGAYPTNRTVAFNLRLRF